MLWSLLIACTDTGTVVDTAVVEDEECPPVCAEGEVVAQGECRAIDPLFVESELVLLGERDDSPYANGRYEVYTDQDAFDAGWSRLFDGDDTAGDAPQQQWDDVSVVLAAPGQLSTTQTFELTGVSVYSQTVNTYGVVHTGGEGCPTQLEGSTPAWLFRVPEGGATGSFYLDKWTCDCE